MIRLTPVYGNTVITLRRRISTGSMPSSRAARSISRSTTITYCGRLTPRYGPVGALLVVTARPRTRYAGTLYTDGISADAINGSIPAVNG